MKNIIAILIMTSCTLIGQSQTIHIEAGVTIYINEPTAVDNTPSATSPTLFVAGDVTNTGSIQNNGEIQIEGNLNSTGTFISTGDEVMLGTTNQTLQGSLSGTNGFYNLILDKNANSVSMTTDVDVSNSIKLMNGVLVTNANSLYLKNTSASALVGSSTSGDTNNFINGTLKQDIATGQNYSFAVGDATHGNQVADMNFTNLGGASFMVINYNSAGAGTITPIIIPASASCNGTYDKQTGTWNITANGTNGNYDYTIMLHPGGDNATALNGAIYDAMQKDNVFANDPCAAVLNNNSATGLNSFSTFKMLGGITSALPVELISFEVIKQATSDLVKWTTATEINSSHFNVQRSANGVDFLTLGKVNSKGNNSTNELNYSFIDETPQVGHNYYRLEQVDIDGKKSYSKIIDIIWTNSGPVSLYPNPTKDQLNIDYSANKVSQAEIRLMDMSGRVVKSIVSKSALGINHMEISLNELASGIYHIQLFSNSQLMYQGKVNKK